MRADGRKELVALADGHRESTASWADLPKSAQRTARKALAGIRNAEDREHAEAAIDAFVELFGAKYPKAVAKIVNDRELEARIRECLA